MKILTSEQMQEVDRTAIDVLGVPGMVLMENAALGVVDALVDRWPDAEHVEIFCGPGNNGGDGFAVGRHLDVRGFRVGLQLAGRPREGSDAHRQWEICRGMGMAVASLETEEDLAASLERARSADVVVDALFGTGLTRPLEDRLARLVEGLQELGRPLLAVDLPSGLDASRHQPLGPHPRVDLTVTFAAPKVAQILHPAAASVGDLVVTDLGVPPSLVEESPSRLFLVERELLQPALPRRYVDDHKGSFGHLLLVAGGPGKGGAAVLAARGALRSGAGLVTVAVPEGMLPTVDAASAESMTLALPSEPGGGLGRDAIASLLAAAEERSAVGLGPGLGLEPQTVATVRDFVGSCDRPLVVDADGLNALAGYLEPVSSRKASTVLTPHPGELARLLGTTPGRVQEDRLNAARTAAERTGCVVVLKGHQTLIAEADGSAWVNPTGNPGMATGGSGDVLTGMIGALLAQGIEAPHAARLGVYLHGLAGDLAAARMGWASLVAGDLLDALPAAFRELESGP